MLRWISAVLLLSAQDETPKQQQAVVTLGHLAFSVMMYREFNGAMPKTLQDLVVRPKEAKVWPEGGFFPGEKIPKDPWGNEYRYEPGTREPKIWSWGSDGKEGGGGEAADLTLDDVIRGRGEGRTQMPANERMAVASLKTICTAQADFRANDRDNNQVNDFWAGDVAGLFCIDNSSVAPERPSAIKLIDLGLALADYLPWTGGLHIRDVDSYSNPVSSFGKRAPRMGYWFAAMKEDLQAKSAYRQDTGGAKQAVYNTSRFGLCAFPSDYPKSGRKTFIVNEACTIFWKDTGGKPVESWPTDAELAEQWKRVD